MGGGGLDLNIISRWGEVKVNFHLVRGGCDLILSLILPISQPPPPPLQVIIAQSLIVYPKFCWAHSKLTKLGFPVLRFSLFETLGIHTLTAMKHSIPLDPIYSQS